MTLSRRPQHLHQTNDTRSNAYLVLVLTKLRRRGRRLSRYITARPLLPAFAALCVLTVIAAILRRTGSHRVPFTSSQLIWLVGVSRVDITPVERVWLSGFASRNRTVDSATPLDPSIPLYARVFSLRPGSNATTDVSQLVIVALDLIGIDRRFSDRVHSAAAEAHGLQRANLHIIPSHTHSGPVVGRNLAPLVPDDVHEWAKIERYTDFLLRRILAAIAAALRERSLVPAAGRFAIGNVSLAVNRRQVKEAEYDGIRRGETDDSAPVMWFFRESGDVVAGLYGYAAHATVLTDSFRYSGDYPALTSDVLERKYPGSRWFFLPGCGGDQNIYPRGSVTEAKKHALVLSRAVSSAMEIERRSTQLLQHASLTVHTKNIALPFEKRRDRKELRRLQRSNRLADQRAATELLRDTPIGALTLEAYSYPISSALISGMQMVFLGGEPTVGFCHSLREGGAGWVVGYCDDVMGYVATEKAREEGGREGSERAALYYGLPAAWKVGAEGIILNGVHSLQREMTQDDD